MANRRIEMYQYRQVLHRMRCGDSNREIARSRLMGRRKAKKVRAVAQQEGWLAPEGSLPDDATLAEHFQRKKPRRSSISRVEPHRKEVTKWFRDGVDGTTIYAALQRKHSFQGSYSSVRRFLKDFRRPSATVILDFSPGETAQVDFGQGPRLVDHGQEVRTWVFVMTLCWSRHQYAELVLDQKVATWLGCHRRAFEFFAGVPQKLTIDNAKCAITRACWRDPTVQRAYAELAEGYGFKIDACPPGEPKKKGRVEAGVKYVKRNFLPLREFRSLADGNRQLETWVLETAGNRIHGTTRERPLARFGETERHLLQALPSVAPEPAVWARAQLARNCHAQFELCRYSAPYLLIGEQLWLRATSSAVQIYRDHEMVATHPRLPRPGSRSTGDDHLPPEALAYKRQNPLWCREQAEKVGVACQALIEQLFAERVLDNLRAAQGVIRLGERYGAPRLEAACQRALAFDNPRYRSVKTILEKGLDQVAMAEAAVDSLAESYTGSGRFSRDTRTLLTN